MRAGGAIALLEARFCEWRGVLLADDPSLFSFEIIQAPPVGFHKRTGDMGGAGVVANLHRFPVASLPVCLERVIRFWSLGS
jgi:hypothetical protein